MNKHELEVDGQTFAVLVMPRQRAAMVSGQAAPVGEIIGRIAVLLKCGAQWTEREWTADGVGVSRVLRMVKS